MTRLSMAALLAAVAVLVCSCATKPEIPYDRAAANVHSIAVVTPVFPNGASVVLASSVGQSFGLVGALVDAGIRENQESRLKAILNGQNFSARELFMKTLQDGLAADGYSVSAVNVQRPNSRFLEQYPATPEQQPDAYLDIVVNNYGYVSAGVMSDLPYRPQFYTTYRLVSARDKSVLAQDIVWYDAYNNPKNIVTISPAPEYVFDNVGMMEKRPADTVAGLRDAIVRSTQTVTGMLK